MVWGMASMIYGYARVSTGDQTTDLQKLYGANSGIGADGMIVVTTSGYSADALAYASDTGIETIDGDRLVDMCRAAWGTRRPQAILPAAMATLTRSELRSGYPADMR